MKIIEKAKKKICDHPTATAVVGVTVGIAGTLVIGGIGYKMGRDIERLKSEVGLGNMILGDWMKLTRPDGKGGVEIVEKIEDWLELVKEFKGI